MKTLILGLGKSGRAAKAHLEGKGHEVMALDDAKDQFGIEVLKGVKLFVPSPGVSRHHPLYLEAKEREIEIAGELELGLRACEKPCIGVTGTNGKSTLCALVAHILSAAGIGAEAVGNFGVPLLEAMKGDAEVLIVECSSFQLETARTQALEAAALLPITPDHLDRYESFEEYKSVKESIQSLTKAAGAFFYGEMKEAAQFLTSRFGIKEEQFCQFAQTFNPLPHRLEKIKEIGEVLYINDSKSTNISSTLFALSQLERPVILLLGGKDKGLDFLPIQAMQHKVRSIVAFGEAGPQIAEALAAYFPLTLTLTLREAFHHARKKALAGDVILLSPGCSSLDHFDNYMARGEEFRHLVGEIQ